MSPKERKLKEVLIAEFSEGVAAFQKAEGVDNHTMEEILEECRAMWARKILVESLSKKKKKPEK